MICDKQKCVNSIALLASFAVISSDNLNDELLSSVLQYLDDYQPMSLNKTLYVGDEELSHYLESSKVVFDHCKNAKALMKELNNASHLIVDGTATELLNTLKTNPYKSYINDAIAAGQLVVLLAPYQQPKEGIWALYPHNRHLSPKVRLLVDKLSQDL